jgi:hypothetical protein
LSSFKRPVNRNYLRFAAKLDYAYGSWHFRNRVYALDPCDIQTRMKRPEGIEYRHMRPSVPSIDPDQAPDEGGMRPKPVRMSDAVSQRVRIVQFLECYIWRHCVKDEEMSGNII